MVGAAIGIAAGLLMAPRRGEKTRRRLMKGTKKLEENVENYVERSLDNLRVHFNDRIDQLAKKGKDTINHASEKVKIA